MCIRDSLYTSENGLDWTLEGIVLDHQNKDMLIFEGKIGGRFMALTRPAGEVYLCLLYTSDAADERSSVDLGGRRIIKKKKTVRQGCVGLHDEHMRQTEQPGSSK